MRKNKGRTRSKRENFFESMIDLTFDLTLLKESATEVHKEKEVTVKRSTSMGKIGQTSRSKLNSVDATNSVVASSASAAIASIAEASKLAQQKETAADTLKPSTSKSKLAKAKQQTSTQDELQIAKPCSKSSKISTASLSAKQGVSSSAKEKERPEAASKVADTIR